MNRFEARCSDEHPGLDRVSCEVVSVQEEVREDYGVLRVRPRKERPRAVVACVTRH